MDILLLYCCLTGVHCELYTADMVTAGQFQSTMRHIDRFVWERKGGGSLSTSDHRVTVSVRERGVVCDIVALPILFIIHSSG